MEFLVKIIDSGVKLFEKLFEKGYFWVIVLGLIIIIYFILRGM